MTVQQHTQGRGSHSSLPAERRLRDRGDELLADLEMHVTLATDLNLQLADREQARDALIDYCARRMVTHLLAVEQVLYAVAAAMVETRLLARALRVHHDLISARLAELLRADNSDRVAASAHTLVGLLQVSQHVEQQVLIPALTRLPEVDMAALVDDIDTLLAGELLPAPDELDVRETPLARHHPRVFGAAARLAPGESFVLVEDHDPQRLRNELQSAYPDRFGWHYVEAGPDRWRVRIRRRPVGA